VFEERPATGDAFVALGFVKDDALGMIDDGMRHFLCDMTVSMHVCALT